MELIPSYRLGRRDLTHLIPLLVTLVLILPFASMPGDERLLRYENRQLGSLLLSKIFAIVVLAHYLYRSWKFIRRSERRLSDVITNASHQNLTWFKLMWIVAFGFWFLGTSTVVMPLQVSTGMYLLTFLCLCLCFLTAAFLSHWHSSAHPIEGEDAKFLQVDSEQTETSDGKPLMTDEAIEHYTTRINQLLKDHPEFFQKPNLLLSHLAREIGLPAYLTSIVINRGLNKNFYELVNQQRIELAKIILPLKEKGTILDVAYEVGFNSKSTFNTAFKKYTGQTPSEYLSRLNRLSNT